MEGPETALASDRSVRPMRGGYNKRATFSPCAQWFGPDLPVLANPHKCLGGGNSGGTRRGHGRTIVLMVSAPTGTTGKYDCVEPCLWSLGPLQRPPPVIRGKVCLASPPPPVPLMVSEAIRRVRCNHSFSHWEMTEGITDEVGKSKDTKKYAADGIP